VDDIVIAYISGNSPDMLLSILACSSPESNPAIPALLNTRWTPSEMISSLRSRQNSHNKRSTRRNIVTIVLHDDSNPFKNAAHQVSNGLKKTNHQYTCYLPIPKFSHDYFEISTQSGIRNISRPFHDNGSQFLHQRIETCIQNASKSDACILFTSGTTGGSKGVRLSHRALLVQALAKLDEPCGYSKATAMLATTVPLFHVGGLSSFLAVLLARGQLVFPERDGSSSSKFQVQDISKSLQDPYLPANTLVVVPAMLSSFFDSESKKGINLKRFLNARFILIGGQSAPKDILIRCRHCFPNARIVQTYACTEAASSMTYLPLTTSNSMNHVDTVLASTKPNGNCVGSPPNHVELRLYHQKSPPKTTSAIATHEQITNPYELGLIATNGPHVMNGYWQRGAQGSRRLHDDTVTKYSNDNRWFISSDLGFWDDQGRLCFAGRSKDVVRTGGETVLAREVEQVLLHHPNVAECAIFPRIDHRYGEAVACAIVARQSHDDVHLSIDTIKNWCRQKGLAGYKQPKILFLVPSLPRNSSGKVLKHKLVAKFGNAEIQSKL
jgi:acyl-CoA synthetase (AMP-forming)/AMP-acid ligase II